MCYCTPIAHTLDTMYIIIEHLIPSLSIPIPHLQTKCEIALQSTGHTHVYTYTYICSHTSHTHTHVIPYLTTHSLQCWHFADSCSLLTGWQWMAPGGEQPSQQQAIGVVVTWWLWCLLVKHGEGPHQEYLHTDTQSSQWVIVAPSHHTHSVCTSVNDVAMNSVPITSFLWEYTHTLPFVLYVPVCESVLVQSRYMWCFQVVGSCNMLCCTVHCMYKGNPSVSLHWMCGFCLGCCVLHAWFVVDVAWWWHPRHSLQRRNLSLMMSLVHLALVWLQWHSWENFGCVTYHCQFWKHCQRGRNHWST